MVLSPRTIREEKTIASMVAIYCHNHHGSRGEILCNDCADFLRYAKTRLKSCPFAGLKPTCSNCKIHCYRQEMQERARQIMRYSGPRMVWQHPIMAFFHLLDGRIESPDLPSRHQTKTDKNF